MLRVPVGCGGPGWVLGVSVECWGSWLGFGDPGWVPRVPVECWGSWLVAEGPRWVLGVLVGFRDPS